MSVYHGSRLKFDIAKPSFTMRAKLIKGERHVAYEGISLHASPHKWIALSYTDNRQWFIKNGKKEYFRVGVSLFNNNKKIYITGKRNLEYSLKKIYGNGGYLYTFDAKNFKHVKGLGPLEVLSYEEQKPNRIEFIKNPVKEMKKLGVNFIFIDITKNKI